MERYDEYTFFIDDVDLLLKEEGSEEPFVASKDIGRAAKVMGISEEGLDELLAYLHEIKETFKKDLISLTEIHQLIAEHVEAQLQQQREHLQEAQCIYNENYCALSERISDVINEAKKYNIHSLNTVIQKYEEDCAAIIKNVVALKELEAE